MGRRPSRAFAAAFLIASLGRAQAPPPSSAAAVRESAKVSLVLLPVTVLDRKGEPIRGLTLANFQVRDDQRPVRVESLDVEERTPASPATAAAPPPAPEAGVAVAIARRKLVLAFDLSASTPGELADARRAAAAFVRERMETGDSAAVATVGEGRHATISRRFLEDREALVSEVGKVRAPATATQRRDPIPETKSMMEPDAVAGVYARDAEYHATHASSLVDSLEELADALAAVDGPKQVLLFSRGEAGIDGAVGAFRRAQCEIDSIVTGGIAPAETSLSDRTYDDPRGERGIDSLDALSADTGGLLVRSGNDLPDQLARLLSAESVVYVLAFAPTGTGHPGRFHRLTVRVDRPGAHVVCRPGYLEPGA